MKASLNRKSVKEILGAWITHRGLLTFLFVYFILGLNTVYSAGWYPANNFWYYLNVTVPSWNATFGSQSVGNTGFLLFNSLSNSILASQNPAFINITGYDSNNTLLGVVPFFSSPTSNGLLIANRTVNGRNWKFITIWFNQSVQNQTYNYAYSALNIIRYNANLNYPPLPIGLTVYRTASIGTPPIQQFYYNFGTANVAGQLRLFYNLSSGYVLQSSNNAMNNISIAFVPTGSVFGAGSYKYESNVMLQKLTTIGVLPSSLTQANTSNVLVYMNPQSANILFITSNMGIQSKPTSAIFNSLSTVGTSFGVNFQPTYQGNSYQYELMLNFTNTLVGSYFNANLLSNFYLVPAYTTNDLVTANTIGTRLPLIPPVNCFNVSNDNSTGWYYDFQIRRQVLVNSWNALFQTNADPQNRGNTITEVLPNSPYLLMQTTHNAEMGVNCQFVYMRAYNVQTGIDNGAIPFSVVNCNQTSFVATFVLKNLTVTGNTYNTFEMYFLSPNQHSGFSSPAILNAWSVYSTNGIGNCGGFNAPQVPPANAYFINYSQQMNLNQCDVISDGYTEFFGLNTNPSITTLRTPSWMGMNLFNVNSIISPQSFYINVPKQLELATHLYGNYSGGAQTLSNTTNTFSAIQGQPAPALTVRASPHKIVQLWVQYTTNASVQGFQFFFGNNTACSIVGLPHAPRPIPPTNNSFITNTMVASIPSTLSLANASLVSMGLTRTAQLGSIQVPAYVLYVMLLILTILILSLGSHEVPVILGFVFIWIIGILNVQLLVAGIIVTMIYGIYVFIPKHDRHTSVSVP